MRKVLLGLVLVAALAVPAGAVAQNGSPNLICATCNDSGSGWTGCTQATASESGGVSYIAHWHHYLIVNFCKKGGTITSLSIAAHGCDAQGFASCSTGPAWVASGGVGYGWVDVEGHATYSGQLGGSPFGGTSVIYASVAIG